MTEVNQKYFWDRVRAMRKSKGVTQIEIAKRLGITQPTYNRHESGEAKNLTDDMIKRICSALECEREALTGEAEVDISSYPEEVQQWMQTKEGSLAIMAAYHKYKKLEEQFKNYRNS